MNDLIGINDTNGIPIKAGDTLVKHYAAIPEVTEADWAKLQKDNPMTSFGFSLMPHKAIAARDEYWIVEYDLSRAQWIVPRDYNGLPSLYGWEIMIKENK